MSIDPDVQILPNCITSPKLATWRLGGCCVQAFPDIMHGMLVIAKPPRHIIGQESAICEDGESILGRDLGLQEGPVKSVRG
jgi:hypothetical protein